ncbi:MAG TPA: MASE1 domain-containing protein [Candidatus Eisenbacteria bacterium]|nr:MASE1 domain-containing protein [Candidatus Eisenbacteria bacterium]
MLPVVMAIGVKKMLSFVGGITVLAAVYFATAVIGLRFDAVSGFATLVWPPTGIAIAVLFMFGGEYWPGVLLGALLANYFTGAPLLVALGIGIGNTAEAVVAAHLLKKYGYRPAMDRLKDGLLYSGYACLVATLVSPTIGVASLWLGGVVTTGALGPTWFAWWLGDVMGALVVGRLLIVLLDAYRRKLSWKGRFGEAAVEFFIVVALALIAYTDPLGIKSSAIPIVYLVLLPRILIAFRFGQVGSVLSTLLVSSIAVWGTVHGTGPFAKGALAESLFWLQLFLGTTSVATMLIAAANLERKAAEEELRRFNKGLEKRISERTAQLAKANEQLEQSKQSLDKRRAVLQAVLHSIGEGVTAVDTAGNPIMINPAAVKMIGMEPSEALFPLEKLSERFPAFFPDGKTPVPLVDLPITRALRGEATSNERMILKSPRAPKGIMVSVTGSPINDEKGNIIGGVAVFRELPGEQA